jgi:hypothetical protein
MKDILGTWVLVFGNSLFTTERSVRLHIAHMYAGERGKNGISLLSEEEHGMLAATSLQKPVFCLSTGFCDGTFLG